MNIVSEAIRKLRYPIPDKILDLAFVSNSSGYANLPISRDEVIRREIIEGRVLADLNMIGGQEVTIPLGGIGYTPLVIPGDLVQSGIILTIPPERRNGKRITSVKSVAVSSPVMANGNHSSNSLLNEASVGTSHLLAAAPPITHNVIMLNENQILIKGIMNIIPNMKLVCIITNDDNLSNINPRSFPAFYNLVLLACKMYIYTNLVIRLDQGFLQGGFSLGSIKEVVDSYSDAATMYEEALETWGKVAIFNDEAQRKKHIGFLIGRI